MSDTAAPPMPDARTSDLLSRYSTNLQAQNYSSAIGRGAGTADYNKITQNLARLKAKNPTVDFSSAYGGPDYSNIDQMAPGEFQAGQQALGKIHGARVGAGMGPWDRAAAMERFNVRTGKELQGAQTKQAETAADKTLGEAQTTLEGLARSSAVSARDEADMRSRLSAQVRAAESQRLSRVSAAMGLGNMTSSPAAAALASSAATEADNSIVSTLRDMGIQVDELNHQQSGKDAMTLASIASARHALATGSGSLTDLTGQITQIMDAIYSRDQTMQMQRDAIHRAGQTSLAQRIAPWAQMAGSVAGAAMGNPAALAGAGGGGAPAPSNVSPATGQPWDRMSTDVPWYNQ